MKYYKRLIDDRVRAALEKDEAIFILGARQVGKTTLMKNLMRENKNSYYLDLENPEYLSIINQGTEEFKTFLDSRDLSEESQNLIFIDEIQYAKDFSSLIKYFVDNYSERYKLILSGSSSLQTRQKFNLEKTDQFNHLVSLLATIMGKELNFSKLATEIKLHKQTLQNYINALEQAYIIRLIQPYYKNLATELRKTPKCFFLDNGIRNLLINNFSDLEFRPDRGEILENCIFTQLQKKAKPLSKINYWRTKGHQEVDFIIQEENKLLALEVKWSKGSPKNIRKFGQVYSDSETFIVSNNLDFDKANNILPAYLI